jgi:hypothetical protein
VRKLGLNGRQEWQAYCRSGRKPAGIPASPANIYIDDWKGEADWLGTDYLWRPFLQARAFVRKLGIKSLAEWRQYCKSGKKPRDIPMAANTVYADDWTRWADWFGTEPNWRVFKDARTFARRLRLKSSREWAIYSRSGKKQADIPPRPDLVYADAGWTSWPDWLGNGGRSRNVDWRSFPQAHTFVRKLGLKSLFEWKQYCKSDKKPRDIPARPDLVYADAGWRGIPDWLGTEGRK